ncbi:hypothetical protein H4R18_003511 [Coemansia javaensis]|uniref:Uncharacterized protein n=1 Tax=Coemansia javaensis TaxID=2761396 RepID=A0A9W8LH65_9FUNG|nr:hypothetical protein H4R18_003511 [Coemansia javaensis]
MGGGCGQYIALTVAVAGLQFAWAVEMGFGTPYLLSLGLPKSLASLVWLAGPLSGLVMQPLVGVLSDRSTSRFGRRRPFIVGSTACAVACLGVIGWTREIAGGRARLAVWLAVGAFYVLDFAVNALQGCLRALIVDVLPAARQDAGTAWASRMIGVGNVCGFLMGFLDLARLLPFLGSTHMQVLTAVAAAALSATVAVTCLCTSETPLPPPQRLGAERRTDWRSRLRALVELLESLRALPPAIRGVFRVQLLAWIGWFPFLFYGTTLVADLYVASSAGGEGPAAMERGTRAGSLAMFAHAIVSLCASIVLPAFAYSAAEGRPSARPPADAGALAAARRALHSVRARLAVRLPVMWSVSLGVFSTAMLLTLLVSSVRGASALLAVCGVSWAVAVWAPFSMLGEAIHDGAGAPRQEMRAAAAAASNGDYVQVASGDIPLEDMGDRPASDDPAPGAQQLSAGTILGVHNVFCVIPQFITAFASSLIFAAFERAQGPGGTGAGAGLGGQHAHQIALVMALGGVSAAAAAFFAWRL